MRGIYLTPNGELQWPLYKCKWCGNYEYWHYSNINPKDEICFTCNFWKGHSETNDDHTVIVDGCHYMWRKDVSPSHCAGFGGAGFKIKFYDGREIVTHNLWNQGEIPLLWRDKMPDNAEFV